MHQIQIHRGARSRVLSLSAFVGISALALAGCSSGAASGDGADKTLTVQVQSVQQPAFEYAAKIFEKENPGVTVKFQTVTEQQKTTTQP